MDSRPLNPALRIVPDSLWEAVQAMRRQTTHKGAPHLSRRPKHFLVAPPQVWRVRWVDDGDCPQLFRLLPSPRAQHGTCTNGRRIGKELIEGQVLKQLAKDVLNPEAPKAAAEDYRKGAAEANRAAGKRIADLRRACPKRGGEVRVDLTGRLRDLLEVA